MSPNDTFLSFIMISVGLSTRASFLFCSSLIKAAALLNCEAAVLYCIFSGDFMNIYKTTQHRRWRVGVLARDKYQCQMCKRKGINQTATEAHHIYPVTTHPELRLILRNGVALCRACHNQIEPRTGEYNPPDWMLRRANKICSS